MRLHVLPETKVQSIQEYCMQGDIDHIGYKTNNDEHKYYALCEGV